LTRGDKEIRQNCSRCKGTGFISGRSPYGVTVVKEDKIEKDKRAFPGVQYINKPTEIVELLKDDIKELIDEGFSAINMDILKQVGENQSGIAKTIDRTDLDSYLLQVSNNIFNHILANSYKFINAYRYNLLLGEKELKQNLPIINEPTEFNVLSTLNAIQEISTAKNAGISDELINALELDLIDKRFANDDTTRQLSRLVLGLDPLPNKTEEEKFRILSNGGITKQDYIISSNIKPFILKLIEQTDGVFLKMKRNEQLELLGELAGGMIK